MISSSFLTLIKLSLTHENCSATVELTQQNKVRITSSATNRIQNYKIQCLIRNTKSLGLTTTSNGVMKNLFVVQNVVRLVCRTTAIQSSIVQFKLEIINIFNWSIFRVVWIEKKIKYKWSPHRLSSITNYLFLFSNLKRWYCLNVQLIISFICQFNRFWALAYFDIHSTAFGLGEKVLFGTVQQSISSILSHRL